MSTPATTAKTATGSTAKIANGTDKSKDDATAKASANAAGDTPEGEGQEKRRRGVVPTMPEAIVYRLNDRVIAAVHNPLDGSVYSESGKGEGSAKGALEDSGFRLGMLYADGPEWLNAKLPAGATLLGFCQIKSFPLPKQ